MRAVTLTLALLLLLPSCRSKSGHEPSGQRSAPPSGVAKDASTSQPMHIQENSAQRGARLELGAELATRGEPKQSILRQIHP